MDVRRCQRKINNRVKRHHIFISIPIDVLYLIIDCLGMHHMNLALVSRDYYNTVITTTVFINRRHLLLHIDKLFDKVNQCVNIDFNEGIDDRVVMRQYIMFHTYDMWQRIKQTWGVYVNRVRILLTCRQRGSDRLICLIYLEYVQPCYHVSTLNVCIDCRFDIRLHVDLIHKWLLR